MSRRRRTSIMSCAGGSRPSRSAISPHGMMALAFTLAAAALGAGGCGSSGPEGPVGGPVTGALDDHCAAVTPIVVNPASCHATPPAGGPAEDNPVHYNAESDDDDCKYHVSFTASPVRLNQNVTFKVTVTNLAGAKGPVTGAAAHLEGTLDDAVAIANTDPKTIESPPGTYTISPVRFPKSGRWVITYHLFEDDCADLEDSPHGHASFYIDVP